MTIQWNKIRSLTYKNLSVIPKGFNGIANIIDSYINGVNKTISRKIDQETSLKLVNRALNAIVKQQLDKQSNSLSYIDMRRLVAEELKQDIPGQRLEFSSVLELARGKVKGEPKIKIVDFR